MTGHLEAEIDLQPSNVERLIAGVRALRDALPPQAREMRYRLSEMETRLSGDYAGALPESSESGPPRID